MVFLTFYYCKTIRELRVIIEKVTYGHDDHK
jgi:hypothetical protein